MRCIFKNGNDIQNILHLNSKDVNSINTICKKYPMLVNEYYLSLIDLNDDHDPIRKMCIPSLWELSDDGHTDTSGEKRNTVMRGVQHKYKQTLLVLSTNECFMYCRHCFRKRMVGITNTEISFRLKQMVDYIKKNPTINNVLISGGDAFCNSNTIIKQYLEQLVGLEQLNLLDLEQEPPLYFHNEFLKIMNCLKY